MTPEQIDALVASIPDDLSPSDRADVMTVVNDLRDPDIGEAIERMYRLAIQAGGWVQFLQTLDDEPTTARSGNFGHSGRLGKVGGSADRTSKKEAAQQGDFLADPKDALAEISEGKPATIAKEHLRDVLVEAAKKGGTPDLVHLTLEGTPLFAGGLNIPRNKMPQVAKELWPDLKKELHAQGVEMTQDTVAPMSLLPTQKEINASRVGGMLAKFEGHKKPLGAILVSQDNFVIDGHHRWALGVMLQTENPTHVKMNVMRIGADRMKALDLLNAYTKKHGIAPEALAAFDPEYADQFEQE